MLKQPYFFRSKPSILPKEALAKFYLSMTFGLSFMISSLAPTRLLTFYAYLITKIRNHNLKNYQTSLGSSAHRSFSRKRRENAFNTMLYKDKLNWMFSARVTEISKDNLRTFQRDPLPGTLFALYSLEWVYQVQDCEMKKEN